MLSLSLHNPDFSEALKLQIYINFLFLFIFLTFLTISLVHLRYRVFRTTVSNLMFQPFLIAWTGIVKNHYTTCLMLQCRITKRSQAKQQRINKHVAMGHTWITLIYLCCSQFSLRIRRKWLKAELSSRELHMNC